MILGPKWSSVCVHVTAEIWYLLDMSSAFLLFSMQGSYWCVRSIKVYYISAYMQESAHISTDVGLFCRRFPRQPILLSVPQRIATTKFNVVAMTRVQRTNDVNRDLFLFNFFMTFVPLFHSWSGYMPWRACGSHRASCRNQFSPSTVWSQGPNSDHQTQ